jgi:hypothetical protein
MRLRLQLIGLLLFGFLGTMLYAQGATHITTSGTLPTTCRVGDVYYKTGSLAGFYNCSATNTWTLPSGAPAGSTGEIQYNNGGVFGGTSTAAGILTWIGTPSSANLASAMTDETGDGALVFANEPVLTGEVIIGGISFDGGTFIAPVMEGFYLASNADGAIFASLELSAAGAATLSGSGAVTLNGASLTVSNLAGGGGQCVQVNNSGVISGTGSACGGSGSVPGGADTSVQFNDGGVFNGFGTWDGTLLGFATAKGLSFAGPMGTDPTTIVGDDDGNGNSTLIVNNAGDAVFLSFTTGAEIRAPGEFLAFLTDAGDYANTYQVVESDRILLTSFHDPDPDSAGVEVNSAGYVSISTTGFIQLDSANVVLSGANPEIRGTAGIIFPDEIGTPGSGTTHFVRLGGSATTDLFLSMVDGQPGTNDTNQGRNFVIYARDATALKPVSGASLFLSGKWWDGDSVEERSIEIENKVQTTGSAQLWFEEGVSGSGSPFVKFWRTSATNGTMVPNLNPGDKFEFAAIDTDDLSAKAFATLTSNSTPSFAIAAPSGGSVTISSNTYSTTANCADSAGDAACAAAAAGSVVVDAGDTTTVVSTTAVTANSQIFVFFDSSLGTRLSVTCNTTPSAPAVTARTGGTSFTITLPAGPSVNPACFSYVIVN